MTDETREKLRSLLCGAINTGRLIGRDGDPGVAYQLASEMLDAILADERTVEVEHEVDGTIDLLVYSDGVVATMRGTSAYHIVRSGSDVERRAAATEALRVHTVRVRYRVPLPPEPVTVEAEVSRE